jgi:hypothetical protein
LIVAAWVAAVWLGVAAILEIDILPVTPLLIVRLVCGICVKGS